MRAFRALILVLALSVCANAGEIPCDRTGDMPGGGRVGEMPTDKTSAIDPTMAITLQILQSVLPLF